MVYRCQMCGGSLGVYEKITICDYCGTKQTVEELKKLQKTKIDMDNIHLQKVHPLLRRAFLCLEDGEFKRADDFCEQVLNYDPENAMAYVGKLMAYLRVKKQEDLQNYVVSFECNKNYIKAIRFADEELKKVLTGYINKVKDRIENNKKENMYEYATKLMNRATTEREFMAAQAHFKNILDFKNSKELTDECEKRAIRSKKDEKDNEEHKVSTGQKEITKKQRVLPLFLMFFLIFILSFICTNIYINNMIAYYEPGYEWATGKIIDSNKKEDEQLFEKIDEESSYENIKLTEKQIQNIEEERETLEKDLKKDILAYVYFEKVESDNYYENKFADILKLYYEKSVKRKANLLKYYKSYADSASGDTNDDNRLSVEDLKEKVEKMIK